jgi:hypothetical protein
MGGKGKILSLSHNVNIIMARDMIIGIQNAHNVPINKFVLDNFVLVWENVKFQFETSF